MEYFPPGRMDLINSLLPILKDTIWWDKRFEIEWYINLCEIAGFCNTDDMRRLCAKRYIAGKRKVNPPGTSKRKEALKLKNKFLSNIPKELEEILLEVCSSPPAEQFKTGNLKAINSLVGMILKRYKMDPGTAREILEKRLGE